MPDKIRQTMFYVNALITDKGNDVEYSRYFVQVELCAPDLRGQLTILQLLRSIPLKTITELLKRISEINLAKKIILWVSQK
jgi:hypothetical protein